ncbi:MAG: hypothetical protein ACRC13_05770 [Tannerellaceae bacterium]
MEYTENQILTAQDLSFIGILSDVKRSKTSLQPVFEGFTNAIEGIKIKQLSEPEYKGKIDIAIYSSLLTDGSTEFDKLSITDNGVGFNPEQFKRFNRFKDISKGFKNLGSGRIQYAHFFDITKIESVFEHEDSFFKRDFLLSKKDDLIKINAIVKHIGCQKIDKSGCETVVTFQNLLDKKTKVYSELNEKTLKEKILEHYIHYFCHNRSSLPEITISFFVQNELKESATISDSDIPSIDKTVVIPLFYRKDVNGITEETENKEEFNLDAFKIPKKLLKENKINLVSKGEVCKSSDIYLDIIPSSDSIGDYKYLFLVSSDYIDERDTNLRGELNIPKRSDNRDMFADDEQIYIEDIQEVVNKTINEMYPELEEIKAKHEQDLSKLKKMFLLDDKAASNFKISINDSDSKILGKFYEFEARKAAEFDASIKNSVDNLERLDPTADNYQEELMKSVEEFVQTIPNQNTIALTHYVARRKLVLELFQKILKNETDKLRDGRRIDENVLHNLIFQQSSKDTTNSDLWLINEEYIYFKGVSESRLGQIEYDGEKILKETMSAEEEAYRKKQNGDALSKRTDILLFPQEGKCIIIELKAPDVTISHHLTQINRYASLINNLSKDTFKFTTFYGYLIGEDGIDIDDILDNDSDFVEAPNLGYIIRPYKKIIGKFGRENGSLYTEIIKYSTLLERAMLKNKIFIDKLTKLRSESE